MIKLDLLSEEVDAENLFESIDNYFSASFPVNPSDLIGVGSDGTMDRKIKFCHVYRRSRLSLYLTNQCNCHVAPLIGNHANSVLPDYLDDITI